MNDVLTPLLWFRFDQNNSGGYFNQSDTVCETVFIQARNAGEAIAKAREVFYDYMDYCPCCGERWSFWVEDKDGTPAPEMYGVLLPLVEEQIFRKQALLHHYDGRVERVKFKPNTKGMLT